MAKISKFFRDALREKFDRTFDEAEKQAVLNAIADEKEKRKSAFLATYNA